MGGWNTAGNCGWQVRRDRKAGVPQVAGRWTVPDVAVTVVAFVINRELGLAFLALKLWHQASGYPGNVFSFAHAKWDGLVALTRNVMGGFAGAGFSIPMSMPFAACSSGNHAFDAWRRAELDRIESERSKLRASEREFAAYRDELLHAKDQEDFERFMQSRAGFTPDR